MGRLTGFVVKAYQRTEAIELWAKRDMGASLAFSEPIRRPYPYREWEEGMGGYLRGDWD